MSKKKHDQPGLPLFDEQGSPIDSKARVSPTVVPKKKPLSKKEEYRRRAKGGFQATSNLLERFEIEDKGGYITQEFQDFGYQLAVELNDLKHKSLYMRLAKKEKRGMLEHALSFVKDAKARSKAKLFMWKLKQLKEERDS